MKFTVKREKLQKALQKVGSIIGSRTMLPLLGNVLIQAEAGMLKLCTTDLELRLSTEIEAEVAEAGATTLPARKLAQLAGCFTAEEVEFNVDAKDHARITCGTMPDGALVAALFNYSYDPLPVRFAVEKMPEKIQRLTSWGMWDEVPFTVKENIAETALLQEPGVVGVYRLS